MEQKLDRLGMVGIACLADVVDNEDKSLIKQKEQPKPEEKAKPNNERGPQLGRREQLTQLRERNPSTQLPEDMRFAILGRQPGGSGGMFIHCWNATMLVVGGSRGNLTNYKHDTRASEF